MLTHIQIQNFAISSATEVALDRNMTVLTGETGAGKSILIDALNLVLGGRADATVVRHDADKAVINASFELNEDSSVQTWLLDQGIDEDNECHLRRVIFPEGRSRAFINNNPVNLATLKALGEQLIDIHGQHEHQTLTQPNRQRELLDSSGNYRELLTKISSVAIKLRQCQETLQTRQHKSAEQKAKTELIKYQVDELLTASIDKIDIQEILLQHDQLSSIEAIQASCGNVIGSLKANEQSIDQQLNENIARLEPWQEHHNEISTALEILHDMQAMANEAYHAIGKATDQLENNPQELEQLNRQMEQCHALARKHQVRMQELPELLQNKQQQLASFEQHDADTTTLEKQISQLTQKYSGLVTLLHQNRSQHALKLSAQVTANMQELGMKGGQFQIRVELDEQKPGISKHGADQISCWVSANPGYPLRPLNKVVSGGELSRISLAITVTCSSTNQPATMIFDEIDSGIGGSVAAIVGKQLQAIGKSQQVLCVTHLPQVAAQANHHFRVIKTSSGASTESRITRLNGEDRIHEIARMLGGIEITPQTLAHARELLDFEITSKAG